MEWVRAGNAGDMAWLTEDWVGRAGDPQTFVAGAKSVICVALSYAGSPATSTPAGTGRVARYAGGADYHDVVGSRLGAVCKRIEEFGGKSRPFVDSAPTMDKALAVRAGLGWQGKNTNILNRELGSFFFLGGILTNLEIEPDQPVINGCGSCRACVAVCPTGALKGDYTIDASLCISYLTIEHRGPIPRHLRSLIGDWVFGCDLCQDVCPPVAARQDREYPDMRLRRMAFARSVFGARGNP